MRAAASDTALRDLLKLRLRATAALQMQLAASLIGKDQDTLRRHFQDSAALLLQAHRELGR